MARDVDAADLTPASTDRGPDRQLEQSDLKELIRQALAALPDKVSREAVVLRDLQEFSYLEIAERLHLPEGTVNPASIGDALNLPGRSRVFRNNGHPGGRPQTEDPYECHHVPAPTMSSCSASMRRA